MAGDEAGPDVARAREVLVEMQMRIEESAQAALGVPSHATQADIRRAFLMLAKTFHPTKFGRLPIEIQKQATEVFLALRAAHDALAKSKNRTTASSMPAVRATAQQPPMSKSPSGQQPTIAAPRTKTDQLPVVASVRPAAPPPPQAAPPQPQLPRRTPTASPAPKHRTPAGGVPIPRPAPSAAGSGAMPAMDSNLVPIYDLMQRSQWDQARVAINALVAREPNAPKYKALLSYTRGREAQLDRRLDEARVELDNALQLDPDLQIAKTALAELFTRRK